jgi:hypothetical protein
MNLEKDKETEEPTILFHKNDFVLKRLSIHHYTSEFTIENNNIFLDKLIDFNFMKLIYDLNSDIYIDSQIEKINDNEAIFTCILKHFFEDLGLPQKYSYMRTTKQIDKNNIIFISKSITSFKPTNVPIDSELLSINELICTCNIESQHKINFLFDIKFDPKRKIPPLPVIKIVGVILNKIFKRVKQFIENLRL